MVSSVVYMPADNSYTMYITSAETHKTIATNCDKRPTISL